MSPFTSPFRPIAFLNCLVEEKRILPWGLAKLERDVVHGEVPLRTEREKDKGQNDPQGVDSTPLCHCSSLLP